MSDPNPDDTIGIHPRLLTRLTNTIAARTDEFQILRLCAASHLQSALAHLLDLQHDLDPATLADLSARCRDILVLLDELEDSALPSQSALAAVALHLKSISDALTATSAHLRDALLEQATQG